MTTNKNTPVAENEQGANKINQAQDTTGFETCQDINAIKKELARLEVIIKETGDNDEYANAVVRYWAIRWVLGWEKEIPK
jgi:hypothetical protein